MQRKRVINAGQKLCNMVGLPWVSRWEAGQTGGSDGTYIMTAGPWCVNNIYDQFIMTTTVDKIIKTNMPKVPQKEKG